jgi:hypothetical protein
LEDTRGNLVAVNIKVNWPREIFFINSVVLVTGNIVEDDCDWEALKKSKNLQLQIRFGRKILARIGVGKGVAHFQMFKKTFTVHVVR